LKPHESTPRIILGIDPGSHITGYAFLTILNGNVTVLDYGVIRSKAQDPLSERLFTIASDLEEKIKTHHPTELCMESAFVAKNARSALVLGHVRGAILLLCGRYGLTCSEISPRSVKQAVTGSGSADKTRVARMIRQILRLSETQYPADATDALAIAWSHLNPNPLTSILVDLSQKKSKTSRKPSPIAPKNLSIINESTAGRIATALPVGTDPQAFLQAHFRKKSKRK